MQLVPFLLAAAVLYFIQALLVRSAPLAPDFAPVLAVYLGLFARREWLSAAALVAGLLRAALCLEPSGVLVLLALALAHGVHQVRAALFGERPLTQWVVAFAAGAAYVVLRSLAGLLVDGAAVEGIAGAPRVIAAVLFATLLAPGVFGVLRLLRVGP